MDREIVVIGSGVIGASTAYHLKRLSPGTSVTVLERMARPGAGNTAKSAALYRNIFSSRASRLLASSSIDYYLTLGDEVQIKPIGYLWMFSREQWDGSAHAIGRLDRARDDIELVDRDRIGQMFRMELGRKGPFPEVHAGILGHRCGSLSGMSLAEHYLRRFKEAGGEVRFDTGVSGFVLKGREEGYAPWAPSGVEAVLDDRGKEHGADHFVSCVGAWTQELLGPVGVFTSTLPKKRQLFGIKVDNPWQVVRDMDPSKVPAMILPAGGTYVKPLLDRGLMILGLADDMGRPFCMTSDLPETDYFEKAISPVLAHYFPSLKDWELKMKWAGHYSYHLPDKNPVVETAANLTWAAGTSGSGIMKADAVGRIAAARALGSRKVTLYDGSEMDVMDLSLTDRNVEKEIFVI